ncbi:MAG: hypothetical protein EOO89_10630 [Pedobacter sp.]|nr:MAG: hypothetical protein EOO89_10630 [Pedobacter sp.]
MYNESKITFIKCALAFLMIGYSTQASAIADTITVYLNKNGRQVNSIEKAEMIWRSYKLDNGNWVRMILNKHNVPIKKETFSDESLSVLSGSYTSYKNGIPYSKGAYLKGHKAGSWITFTSELKAAEVKNYVRDTLNGKYVQYWPDGSPKITGNFFKGQKDGEWKYFYKDGKNAIIENYTENGEITDSLYQDNYGNKVFRSTLLKQPTYPGGPAAYADYLSKNLKNPWGSQNAAIGTVIVSFIVNLSGEAEDLEVIAASNLKMADEALRVIKASKWIQGNVLGEPASLWLQIPIKFSFSAPRTTIKVTTTYKTITEGRRN